VNTHILACPCGYEVSKGFSWLDLLEMQKLHNRRPGHAAVIELVMTK